MEETNNADDGSLSFLNIPRDEKSRSFNCDETTQSKLVNTTFWVMDFIEEVPTKFSKQKGTNGQTLVKIKPYIEQGLKLEVKSNWQIFPIADNRQDRHGRALDYVGYKFFRRQKLMRKSIKQNLCRAIARIRQRTMPVKAFKQYIAPWLGWAKHSNSKHLLQTIIPKDYASIL